MTNEEKFVNELIGYIFAYPDDDYMTMECLCRKLHKHGLIEKKDGEWTTDFIDRKTEPSNCRWATKAEQANNKTNTIVIEWNGEAHTISEWAEITGISRSTLNNRHWRGWDAERMLTAPITHGNQYTFYKAEREAKECHAT